MTLDRGPNEGSALLAVVPAARGAVGCGVLGGRMDDGAEGGCTPPGKGTQFKLPWSVCIYIVSNLNCHIMDML